MAPPAIVRRLTVADAGAYRTIRLATLRTEPAFFGSLHETEAALPLGAFEAALVADDVFGACRDGLVVGVARLHSCTGAKERHKASLHGVFVQPGHRGAGVGSTLLAAVIDTARASHEQLVLSVDAGNAPAISLYEKLGFRTFGIEPRARKHDGRYSDLVSMILRLDGA